MDLERISSILLRAQDRLREAMLLGAVDLDAGLAAWDRAVRCHNAWTAAATHALHTERRAADAFAALEAWAFPADSAGESGNPVPPAPIDAADAP